MPRGTRSSTPVDHGARRSPSRSLTARDDVILQPTHAGFAGRLGYEEWRRLGPKLARRASASQWWLGDRLVFGRDKYRRRYAEALETTGLTYQTLRSYAVVARRFPPERRLAWLSFQHHAEVCALPDEVQDELLRRAATEGWTRSKLRGVSRRGEPAAERGSVRLRPTHEQRDRWDAAAAQAGMGVPQWIVAQLNAAARLAAVAATN